MSLKNLLTKPARRYVGAAIAAGVTTFVAIVGAPLANAETCSLRDATSWQIQLTDGQIEQSPEHRLELTERFLEACPNRPEVFEASRIAGIAALDLDDAERAVRHFDRAGLITDLHSNFYHMSALIAVGEEEAAWQKRDWVVDRWLSRLDAHPLTIVESQTVPNGTIHRIYFAEADRAFGVKAAWVAVPKQAGWPATLSFSNDRKRLTRQKISVGQTAEDVRYVDFNRCRGRTLLARHDADVTGAEIDASAETTLLAYLAKPDGKEVVVGQDDISICILPGRLLPFVKH